jgi:hypothetical protein
MSLVALCSNACGGSDSSASLAMQASAGSASIPILGAGSGSIASGAAAQAGAAALASAGAFASAGSGGALASSAGKAGGAGATSASAGAAAAGSGGAQSATYDNCVDGELPDSRDPQLSGKPEQWKDSGGAIDLVLPKLVLGWMGERIWEQSHDAWHNIRRCRSTGGAVPGGGASNAICSHTELIPAHAECSDAEDGYQFLLVHRHMLTALRQSFPQHVELFQGFPHFPYNATDVPAEWQGRFGTGWSAAILQTAKTLEDIENQLSQFPTEGDLGRFIQCGGMASGASSIHGALHFKWVVNSSPYSLGKQSVNIDNYMFWKLHGWIDEIWERYRVAKGLAPNEPKLKDGLTAQCREMHALSHAVSGATEQAKTPLPVEHGEFHEKVRPILEKTCASCHSETSPEAGMSLGGHISSADVVKGLVNVASMRGGQFQRVLPGNAQQSWLYLKASGMAMAAGCSGAACNAQVMPPTGQVTLSATDLDTIRQWISDGAPAPTP